MLRARLSKLGARMGCFANCEFSRAAREGGKSVGADWDWFWSW